MPNLTEQQNEELTKDISELEIKKAIKRLKSKKSPGSDGYTAEWYKELKFELIPLLLPTVNWVLKKILAGKRQLLQPHQKKAKTK